MNAMVERTAQKVGKNGTGAIRKAVLSAGIALTALGFGLSQTRPEAAAFPDTDAMVEQVVRHQKEVESLLTQYTFTDTTTVYTLDKNGQVRAQHSDTYYITPTAYEVFVLHVSHDGKSVPEKDLHKQQDEIEHKIRRNEEKAQKPGELHPKNALLFADIVKKSRLTPLRWDEVGGKRVVAYAFEPKSNAERKGDFEARIAGDMKGTMWIAPEEAEIVRLDCTSVAPLNVGMGLLGSVKGFEGFVTQRKVHDEVWLPSHQEFLASGRQLVKGFRIRQVDEFSDYLKATTDVFQQLHDPKPAAATQQN